MSRVEFKLKEGEQYIQLIQLLKVTNLVFNGAEAQKVVTEGMVLRNGTTEFRKRAKIVAGEVIQFADYEILVK